MGAKEKQAIVVLGGGLLKDSSGRWKTVDLVEGSDNFAVTNDRWRVKAAFYLWRQNPDFFIITSGGKGQLKKTDNAPTIALVIKKELMELGVSSSRIILEEGSNNTFEQLKELANIVAKEKIAKLKIISNEWHLPRVKAIFEFFPGLKKSFGKVSVDFFSAEKILLENDPDKWRARIEKARQDPKMKKRFELEKQGIKEIKLGTYEFFR